MSSKPTVAIGRVPSVKELCEQLGFQHASLKDTNNFMEGTRAWRKSYTTISGRPATILLQWNDMTTQFDLEEMAQAYLDHGDNGNRFWSPHRSWIHDSNIKYPEDSPKIVAFLKQLFWKQNRYAFNNSHYGAKASVDLRDGSREKTTPDRRIESGLGPSAAVSASPLQAASKSPKEVPPCGATEPRECSRNTSVMKRTRTLDRDILDGPNELDSDDEVVIISRLPPPRSKRPALDDPTESYSPSRKKYRVPAASRRTTRKQAEQDNLSKATENQVDSTFQTFAVDKPATTQPTLEASVTIMPVVQMRTTRKETVEDISSKVAEFQGEPAFQTTIEVNNPISEQPSGTPEASVAVIFHASSHEEEGTRLRRVIPQSQFRQVFNNDRLGTFEASTPVGFHKPQQSTKAPSEPAIGEMVSPPKLAITKPQFHQVEVEKKKANASLHEAQAKPIEAKSSLPEPESTPPFEERIARSKLQEARPKETQQEVEVELPLQEKEPTPQTTLQPTSSKPRSKTQIALWIITREPRYTEERWDKGKFMGTTLAAFIEGISGVTQRQQVEGIKLTLRAPTFDTKITVLSNADESWESAKETFTEKLKEAKADARAKGQIEQSFKILIEPFYEEGVLPNGNDLEEDDDDLEF